MTTDVQQLHEVEVTLLRDISSRVTDLGKDLKDVRDRVIRIESQDALAKIDRLETFLSAVTDRVNTLESDRDKRVGMQLLLAWLTKNAGWIFLLLMGGIAYYRKGAA